MKAIPCEVYSRIVGYFSPVRNWNKGKQKEFADRKAYTEVAHDPIGQSGGDRDGAHVEA